MILPHDFFFMLFERMPGPMYVMRVPERIFEKVNLAMAELMGGGQAEIEGKKAADFIDPGEWDGIVAEVHAERSPGRTVTYDFNCKTLQGRIIPLEVSVMNLPSPYENLDIGIVRDLSNVSELEKTISTQKAKINAAMMANSRLWAITDKIRAAYIAMEKLAQAKNVDALLEDAHDLLLKSDGLDFKAAIVYLRDGDWLKVAKGTAGTKARAISLKGNGRLERFFNTNDNKADIRPGEIVFSLRAEGANIGLLRVIEHEGVSQETEAVKHMREVIVKTLSNTMGLMIEKIRLYQQVEEQSTRDSLTKVFNRRHFDAKMEEEIERVGRNRRPMTLILLDIDHFKSINDTYGHLQGDRILEEIGRLLTTRTRKSDVVCRYGGEEFVILMPLTEIESALGVAEDIRKKIESHRFTHISTPEADFETVTVSMGISTLMPARYGDSDKIKQVAKSLIQAADEALYKAKQGGRNRIVSQGGPL